MRRRHCALPVEDFERGFKLIIREHDELLFLHLVEHARESVVFVENDPAIAIGLDAALEPRGDLVRLTPPQVTMRADLPPASRINSFKITQSFPLFSCPPIEALNDSQIVGADLGRVARCRRDEQAARPRSSRQAQKLAENLARALAIFATTDDDRRSTPVRPRGSFECVTLLRSISTTARHLTPDGERYGKPRCAPRLVLQIDAARVQSTRE